MKTRRINTGIYELTAHGNTYQVEKYPDGAWLLFIMVNGSREYCNDFPTLRDAKQATWQTAI